MIDICITIDTESSTRSFDAEGRPIHLGFERDVWSQCEALERLADRFDVPFTFFYPLSELNASDARAGELAARLARRHELAVHLHRPFGAWNADRIAETLAEERTKLERTCGRSVVSVRAGGYNTGEPRAWIAGAADSGHLVDSSVWSGATSNSPGLATVTRRLDERWGQGSVAYDYRNAPVAGSYRTSTDSLIQPGNGPLIEAPIAVLFEEQAEPGPYRLDPRRMPADLMIEALELLAARASDRALAVIFLHSNGLANGRRLTRIGMRLARVLEWAAANNAQVRTLASLGDEDLDRYGPIFAPNQPGAWPTQDHSGLRVLIRRCPRCGAGLDDLRCPSCGWSATVVTRTYVDARVVRAREAAPMGPPSRMARRLRAGLALTGGALGAALGNMLYPLARARRALKRG